MKKYFSLFAVMVMACCLMFSLTACGDDDKENDGPDIPGLVDATPVSADLAAYAWFSEDMVDVLNIDVAYVDADGVTHKAAVGATPETVTYLGKELSMYPVKASVSTAVLPAGLDMKISYTKKPGVAVSPDRALTFTFVSQNEAYVTYSDGRKLGAKNPILGGHSVSFKGDKLDTAVERFSERGDRVTVGVEQDGKINF